MALTLGLQAQTTPQPTTTDVRGAAKSTTEKMTGEVAIVEGNRLVVLMQPSGQPRLFTVAPGRQFIIDGVPKMIGDLKPGTVLTATVTTTVQDVTARTTSVTSGTVFYAKGTYVVLELPNGEVQSFNVPDGQKFVVDGRPAGVDELRDGMKVSATRVIEEPRTEMSTETVVTGTAPK